MSLRTDHELAETTDPHTTLSRRVARFAGPMAAVVVATIGLLSGLSLRLPAPAPITAPASTFSADRAATHLTTIAEEPRPTGSTQLAKVGQYLLATRSGLGLTPTTTTRSVCRDAPVEAVCGTVTDIRAVIPGREADSSVVLVSHYDSTGSGRGAVDDGFGLATILEVARAVKAGPYPPRQHGVADDRRGGTGDARVASGGGRRHPA
jgi:hypothetical protein